MNLRRLFTLTLVVATIAALTATVAVQAQTVYYVSPTGSDSNPGTSAAPFRTIQHAANLVNPGDTVIVEDGVYNEGATSGSYSMVSVQRSGTASAWITFKSANKWGAQLDGLNQSNDGFNLTSGVSYIRVQDFEIYRTANVYTGGATGVVPARS